MLGERKLRNPSLLLVIAALAAVVLTFGRSRAVDVESPAAGGGAAIADSIADRVDEYLSRMVPFGWHGAVLVSRGQDVLLAKGYGRADHGSVESAPVRSWTSGTVSTVGSITKQFTAAAIMKLVQQGRLSVRDSLPVFFDDVPAEKREITLHHLLTHTSGLRVASDSLGDFDFVSREEIVRAAMTQGELATEPGEEYAYSNLGYSLLGAVVEVVTDTDYEAWLREHLFVPVGMYETGYLLPAYEAEHVATGYRGGERWGTVIRRLPEDTGPSWILRANGGIHSTLYDMHRWVRTLMTTDRILSPASREKLLTPYADEGYGSYYAYGWGVDTTARSTPVIRHNGGNGILHADLHWFPEDDQTLTFAMSNHAELTAIDVLEPVDDLLFGGGVEMPPRVDAEHVDPEQLSTLAGHYRLPGGSELAVVALGGHLEVRVSGQPLLDRLSTAAREDSLGYAVLNRRAAELIGALFEGDYSTLREAMGGDPPEKPYTGFRERVIESLGGFESADVMGTLPIYSEGSVGLAVTWVRVEFERGTRLVRIHWSADGRMAGVGGQAIPAPLTLSCAMASPSLCIGWDPIQPTVEPTLRFESRGTGRPMALTISAGSWSKEAVRVSGG